MTPKAVLSANLKALMAHRDDLNTLPKITLATNGELSNGKLDRIRRGAATTDVESLGHLADAFGLQAWQLLVPNLDPVHLPALARADLLAEIRNIVSAQIPSEGFTQPKTDSSVRVKKVFAGRVPGQIPAADQPGETGEVNKPGTVPKRRGRGRA